MENLESLAPTETNAHPETLASYIRVHCPSCYKLYSVDPREIHDTKPRFECVSCRTRFWLPFPECMNQKELVGFPTAWLDHQPVIDAKGQLPKATPAAPSSNESKTDGAGATAGLTASHEIRRAWDELILNYDAATAHRKFVDTCQAENNLEYAAHKYGTLLAANPADEIAEKFQTQVFNLMNVKYGDVIFKADESLKKKKAKFRFPFFTFIMVASGIVIAIGFFAPGLRNLVGFGAAIMFFVMGLRLYTRKLFN